jgi:hypothetical protein
VIGVNDHEVCAGTDISRFLGAGLLFLFEAQVHIEDDPQLVQLLIRAFAREILMFVIGIEREALANWK